MLKREGNERSISSPETALLSCLFHTCTDGCQFWHQKTLKIRSFLNTGNSFASLSVAQQECRGCKTDKRELSQSVFLQRAYSCLTKHLKYPVCFWRRLEEGERPLVPWSLEIEEKPRAKEQSLSFLLSQIHSSSVADSRSLGWLMWDACGLFC